MEKTSKEKIAKEQCLFNDECPFYLRPVWTTANRILRETYCYGDASECEILTRYLFDNSIPENMLPDGKIITEGGECGRENRRRIDQNRRHNKGSG